MTVGARAVLVIEDDPDSRTLLAMALEMNGFQVVTAADGRQGLATARGQHPAAIVLDLMMPVMDGEAFRRAQLADEELRRIPVVVVSAHNDARRIADRLGVADCMMKPLDFDALANRIREVTGH
jgi:DNA-binding response OmpR family regulator